MKLLNLLSTAVGLVAITATDTTDTTITSQTVDKMNVNLLSAVELAATPTPIFNVGGRRFAVSRELMKNHPQSLLARLTLQAESEVTMHYFDRSGETFDHMLDYMREGRTVLPMTVSADQFTRELDFYNVDYDVEDIIDGDKFWALKEENSVLRRRIDSLAQEKEKCEEDLDDKIEKLAIEILEDLKAELGLGLA